MAVGHHVELRGFGWRHAGRRAWAVRGLDLRIEYGERVLLLGPSGAGKSTLLAALAGLLAEDSGEQEGQVLIGGVDARSARASVASVFQDPQGQIVMSRCGDDVAFGLENRGAYPIWPRVDAALDAVGFPYPRSRATSALSGGEQQRLALAGALALQPSLLLLDEPTANLDPAGAGLVRDCLARLMASGGATTVVLVEHRVAQVLPFVTRVVALSESGTVLADGDPARVFTDPDLAAHGVWVPGQPVTRLVNPHGPGEVLLRAQAVGYRHPGADRAALSAVDVAVRSGEVQVILGPNGSGKSTLALLLGGLVAPSFGQVVAMPALGTPAAPRRWRARVLARRIGSVFQNPEHQFVTTTVADELALGPRRAGQGEAAVKSIVDDLLGRLRLAGLRLANPFTLSGGEQRRLSVATALATAPRLLLLDEPTFGQDRRTWTELVELLDSLRAQGCGIVAATHDADFVAALADRRLELTPPARPRAVSTATAGGPG
jgi:energy-coupling factor transport system ATP-binding protein